MSLFGFLMPFDQLRLVIYLIYHFFLKDSTSFPDISDISDILLILIPLPYWETKPEIPDIVSIFILLSYWKNIRNIVARLIIRA